MYGQKTEIFAYKQVFQALRYQLQLHVVKFVVPLKISGILCSFYVCMLFFFFFCSTRPCFLLILYILLFLFFLPFVQPKIYRINYCHLCKNGKSLYFRCLDEKLNPKCQILVYQHFISDTERFSRFLIKKGTQLLCSRVIAAIN